MFDSFYGSEELQALYIKIFFFPSWTVFLCLIDNPVFMSMKLFGFFFQRGIHLSIISPRKIPALQKLYEEVYCIVCFK